MNDTIDYYSCAAAISMCEVYSDGKVYPCTLTKNSIPESEELYGDLNKSSLSDIWNGKSFDKFRSYMILGCEGCKAFSKCTKCIAQSYKYFNNGISPSPYCLKNPNINLTKKYIPIIK